MLWTKNMEGGIPHVDAQHKELFRQVDALLNTERPERVRETLGFLEKYVVEHFKTEEIMHAQSDYPRLELHRKMHADFTARFIELKRQYGNSGYNLVILLKLNRAVVSWLKTHVMGEDIHFANYFHAMKSHSPAAH